MTQRPKQPSVKHAEKMRRKSIEQKHLQAAKGGRIDVPFLLLVLLLTIIGLVMLFSASFPSAYYETGRPFTPPWVWRVWRLPPGSTISAGAAHPASC